MEYTDSLWGGLPSFRVRVSGPFCAPFLFNTPCSHAPYDETYFAQRDESKRGAAAAAAAVFHERRAALA